ncbi:AI-2E family transporter [Clostridium sp. D53t1_180928_C8]|uniref:AI-2E family transporter n=1 Tax=Clostridium sp. D53t1_180928_C8 TaxID=2787101 RepID=UPI0018A99555|nr:AI-2E family transporter [Clostridium sp. D53t1_180928_C8]
MIDKLRNNKFYIKYGVIIIFIALVVVLTVKTIVYSENIIEWIVYQFKNFIGIIKPILYAMLLAYLLNEPMMYIEKLLANFLSKTSKKNNFKYNFLLRLLSIILLLSLVIILLVLIYNYIVPPIFKSINEIIDSLPKLENQLKIWTNEIVKSLKDKNIDIPITGQIASEIANRVGIVAEKIVSFFVSSISNISSFILNFIVTIILMIYFLSDKERLIRQLKKFAHILLPNKFENALTIFLIDLDNIVGKFILGEILDSIIVGIVSTILLLIIKHPFAVLIGVLAGITNIIPYIGPILGAVLAFILGIFTSMSMGITGAILLLLYQQIDGNFVQPKIVGDKIGLSPVWILIVVLIGGSYFGALGMILSMPIAGLIRIYLNRYGEKKFNNI